MEKNELNKNAMGGTELMGHALQKHVDNDLLRHFQIIQSRVRDIDPDRKTILWLHDLPGDPEVQHLKNGGWKKFDKLVFVSYWQQQMYNAYLGVPYSAGVVLRNAIEPITEERTRTSDRVRLIYTSTPHRGLAILYPVFQELKKHFNIELDVYSSFSLYGWPQRDEPFKELFDQLKADPDVNYYGAVPNSEIRQALVNADIFAYPSIWQETSCLCLIEAMSAGLTCVHSSLAALPETSLDQTIIYPYSEDVNQHANVFLQNLAKQIQIYEYSQNNIIRKFVNNSYDWDIRKLQWENLLKSMIS